MSSNLVVMVIEGVLVESQDLKTGLPSQPGHMLYDNLRQGYSIVLLTHHERDLVDTWLRKEGIQGYATVMSYAASAGVLSLSAWKATQVRTFRQNDSSVAWFVDTDPSAIEAVYLEGVATMMLSNPHFTRPEFRPDAERHIRPWNQLVTTIETERLIKVTKETS